MHRIRILPCFVLACACGQRSSPSRPVDSPPEVPAQDSQPQDAEPKVAVACPSDGVFDFAIKGSKLDAFEGRLVWAVAVERAQGGSPRRVVRLQGEIQGGRFALSCPHSLRETFAYPSWTVVIDADGDGACSSADRQHTEEQYGWNDSVKADVTLHANGEVADWAARVADAHTVVGDRSSFDFCHYYFD